MQRAPCAAATAVSRPHRLTAGHKNTHSSSGRRRDYEEMAPFDFRAAVNQRETRMHTSTDKRFGKRRRWEQQFRGHRSHVFLNITPFISPPDLLLIHTYIYI